MGFGHDKSANKTIHNKVDNPEVKEPLKNVGNSLPPKETPKENIDNNPPEVESPKEHIENNPPEVESSDDDGPLIKTYHDPKKISTLKGIDQSASKEFNVVELSKVKILEEDDKENAYTYLVKNSKTLTEFAYKRVELSDKNEENIKNILKEIEIIKNLNHPNLIKIYEITVSDDHKYLEILSEFAEGGELQARSEMKKKENIHFPEHSILDWLSQTCFALVYLHDQNILHRNIKPSSLYLMGIGLAKLGNFGLTNLKDSNGEFKRVKTLMPKIKCEAPELYEKKDYSKKTDIWYLGVTFFQLMTYTFPFKGQNDEEIMDSILKEEKNDYNYNYSVELKELINKMISKEPEKRPSASDILLLPIVKKRMESFLNENEANAKNGKNDFGLFDDLDEIEEIYIDADENVDKKEEIKEEKKEEKNEEKNEKKKPKKKIRFVILDNTDDINQNYQKKISKSVNVKLVDPLENNKNEQIPSKRAKKNAYDLKRQMTNIREILEIKKNKI